ncbi:hypothetical protein L280_06380 [Mannheimia haemolytica MhBrain2012]|nr:hypothetical protein F382_07570 [Mannheimia haemolytica D153]AGQ41482.1 hypothetical protein J451_08400 [Mannheimia haemolytica D174]AGR73902.1 hypothetical protein N220_00505 [Mannheimia haemolytica USMARC_2286]EPZ01674.1 hypothetical protein L279_02720 [Mannheimia haemolytica D38]EPZ24955.1 hypothetical protein L277_02505 [Mannheimia haemolytica D193]EPZ25769.1 hypothetical protein L280_06380 [Mannheimia haemolytica MhBrain2012]EPZ28002.1 hypothetical protein L281_01900 [Mannheimia haemo
MRDRHSVGGDLHILLYWATGLFSVWHLFPLVDGAKPTGVSTTADVADFARCVWLWLLVAEFFQQNHLHQILLPQNPGHFVLGSFCGGDVLFNLPLCIALHFGNVERRIK